MEIIRGADVFVEKKIISKNWYASKNTVYIGQADKSLYWWNIEDSNNYCVIYGDLSILEVTENEIPE